ncbi:hypothetical protein NQ318_006510 [Aromia moschata]|uniref:Uncharacterized protein n=1 Tax=Aromia moschata TaxID=1265417 RepID=A0AAV8YQ35_9CUCU|nr:hypothetical protein NQ318_006510 [Aromia moschata]
MEYFTAFGISFGIQCVRVTIPTSLLGHLLRYEVCKLSNETGNVAPHLATLRRRDLEGRGSVLGFLCCIYNSKGLPLTNQVRTALTRAVRQSKECDTILPAFNTHPDLKLQYEVWLLNNRTDAATSRERVATSLNRTVSGDTFPIMSSLYKPMENGLISSFLLNWVKLLQKLMQC